jgi:hypothetical protein
MAKNKRKEEAVKDVALLDETFLGTDAVASGTECTGLIPNTPEDEAQMESYQELYEVPTKVKGPKQDKKQKG